MCSGCAKDEPLSDTQKGQLSLTLDSAGAAYQAARNSAIASATASAFEYPETPSASSVDANTTAPVKRMTYLLQQRIQSSDCQIRLVAPSGTLEDWSPLAEIWAFLTGSAYLGIKRTFMALKIWGENSCPINLNFRIGTLLEPSIGRLAIAYDYSYLASDSTYLSYNDIDSIELHGGTSLNGLNSDQVFSDTSFDGTLHSQSQGNITVAASGSLQGANRDSLNGEVLWRFSYTDFNADFRKSFSSGQISYSLNRQSIDASGFDDFFSRGGDPFLYAAEPDRVH